MTQLELIREAIEKIVVTEGEDAGVVLLSDEAPVHHEFVNGKPVQVYDLEYFSELGTALVNLHRMTL